MVGSSVSLTFSGKEAKDLFGVRSMHIYNGGSSIWTMKGELVKGLGFCLPILESEIMEEAIGLFKRKMTRREISNIYSDAAINVAKKTIEIYKSKN